MALTMAITCGEEKYKINRNFIWVEKNKEKRFRFVFETLMNNIRQT
jgi:hypothetical protein